MQCSAVENSEKHCPMSLTLAILHYLTCSAVLPLQNKKIVQHWISTLSQPIFCLLTCSVSTALVCYYKVRCLALPCTADYWQCTSSPSCTALPCTACLSLHCRLLAMHVVSFKHCTALPCKLHCLPFLALHYRLLALHVISHVMWETGEGVVVVVVTNLLRK